MQCGCSMCEQHCGHVLRGFIHVSRLHKERCCTLTHTIMVLCQQLAGCVRVPWPLGCRWQLRRAAGSGYIVSTLPSILECARPWCFHHGKRASGQAPAVHMAGLCKGCGCGEHHVGRRTTHALCWLCGACAGKARCVCFEATPAHHWWRVWRPGKAGGRSHVWR
ncbi:hypothetical protein COO60DRAFT_1550687 [Scenedesmus sp. NREL 46B-D3]|nr:hypothetical protein COO60DRAFT_1550687 [Scenedesmus sp. NREL 46B-D3]